MLVYADTFLVVLSCVSWVVWCCFWRRTVLFCWNHWVHVYFYVCTKCVFHLLGLASRRCTAVYVRVAAKLVMPACCA